MLGRLFKTSIHSFGLLLFLLLFAGCKIQSADFVIENKEIQPFDAKNNTEINYQYSGPWDKNLFNSFYNNKIKVEEIGKIRGAILPHHLSAGFMSATLFDHLRKQDPSVVVIIGPNHFGRGNFDIITSNYNWQTPFGDVFTDHNFVEEITTSKLAGIDELTMKEEHSIYSLVSFIAKSLPNTKIIPLILKNNVNERELDDLVENLKNNLPEDAVFISSIDFSHYQPSQVSAFHDELSQAVIKNFDYERLSKLEIDSTPSLYVLLKLMGKFGTQKPVFEMYNNPGQTSHYSVWFGNGEKESKKTASLLFFGDLMLDRGVKEQIDKNGADWLFSVLAGEENRFLQGMDDVHINLEGPFMQNCPKRGSMTFCFDPNLIPILKKYNFSIFNLANNHTFNMGQKGLEDTKKNLTGARLEFYDNILTKEIGGLKISFIGFNDVGGQENITGIKETVKELKKISDFVIITPHWGEEYKFLKSNLHQQKIAHDLIDSGADAIIGTHPHVAQEMEIYKNKLIFYSLGNFIFDQYFSKETQMGLGVGLIFSENNNQSIYVFPLQSQNSQVKLMSGELLSSFFTEFKNKSKLNNNQFENFNLKL